MKYAALKDEICNVWLPVSPQEMDQIRIALLELSTSSFELPRMRDIYRCTDLASALFLLEKWKILTPNKVDVLLRLSEVVGQHAEMVRNCIQQYKQQNLSCNDGIKMPARAYQRPNNVNQLYLNICEYLSEDLRGRWIDLARTLSLSDLASDLQRSPLRQKDRIYQVLEEHYNRSGNSAISHLLQALERCSLIRQRDHILRHFVVGSE
ncbi:hypothetical protein SK128_025628 [Halocaridina rubra]|uniref:Death domain-containing protein n=1 Tax=Halocaridina rubra TaxID=373956 RepID=A0AAN9A9D4_HALRR